jgi:hypothetical protein
MLDTEPAEPTEPIIKATPIAEVPDAPAMALTLSQTKVTPVPQKRSDNGPVVEPQESDSKPGVGTTLTWAALWLATVASALYAIACFIAMFTGHPHHMPLTVGRPPWAGDLVFFIIFGIAAVGFGYETYRLSKQYFR